MVEIANEVFADESIKDDLSTETEDLSTETEDLSTETQDLSTETEIYTTDDENEPNDKPGNYVKEAAEAGQEKENYYLRLTSPDLESTSGAYYDQESCEFIDTQLFDDSIIKLLSNSFVEELVNKGNDDFASLDKHSDDIGNDDFASLDNGLDDIGNDDFASLDNGLDDIRNDDFDETNEADKAYCFTSTGSSPSRGSFIAQFVSMVIPIISETEPRKILDDEISDIDEIGDSVEREGDKVVEKYATTLEQHRVEETVYDYAYNSNGKDTVELVDEVNIDETESETGKIGIVKESVDIGYDLSKSDAEFSNLIETCSIVTQSMCNIVGEDVEKASTEDYTNNEILNDKPVAEYIGKTANLDVEDEIIRICQEIMKLAISEIEKESNCVASSEQFEEVVEFIDCSADEKSECVVNCPQETEDVTMSENSNTAMQNDFVKTEITDSFKYEESEEAVQKNVDNTEDSITKERNDDVDSVLADKNVMLEDNSTGSKEDVLKLTEYISTTETENNTQATIDKETDPTKEGIATDQVKVMVEETEKETDPTEEVIDIDTVDVMAAETDKETATLEEDIHTDMIEVMVEETEKETDLTDKVIATDTVITTETDKETDLFEEDLETKTVGVMTAEADEEMVETEKDIVTDNIVVMSVETDEETDPTEEDIVTETVEVRSANTDKETGPTEEGIVTDYVEMMAAETDKETNITEEGIATDTVDVIAAETDTESEITKEVTATDTDGVMAAEADKETDPTEEDIASNIVESKLPKIKTYKETDPTENSMTSYTVKGMAAKSSEETDLTNRNKADNETEKDENVDDSLDFYGEHLLMLA